MLVRSKLEFALGLLTRCNTLGRLFRTGAKRSVTQGIDHQIRRLNQHHSAMMSDAKDRPVRGPFNRANLEPGVQEKSFAGLLIGRQGRKSGTVTYAEQKIG